jgi:hypothetical protein
VAQRVRARRAEGFIITPEERADMLEEEFRKLQDEAANRIAERIRELRKMIEEDDARRANRKRNGPGRRAFGNGEPALAAEVMVQPNRAPLAPAVGAGAPVEQRGVRADASAAIDRGDKLDLARVVEGLDQMTAAMGGLVNALGGRAQRIQAIAK